MLNVLKMIAALAAASMLGNWFLSEVRQARARQEPWYRPYMSIPGILILIFLSLPVFIWLFRN
ncbi:MAG: hypothetical protein V2I97_12010 [Desulfococcaceae bacterium]|nr:hypothetical protein [Desulfococcaceae bacterium]